ncbi:MAG TPA: hypothetical protein VNA29_04935, partial [Sphingomicrobium sp.]|nr:hypothetical protein [Sphingomicrobium sp.]
MNLVKMGALVWPLALLSSQDAIAQNNEVSIGFAKPREVNPSEPRWVVCTTTDNVTKKKYIGEIKTTTAGALAGKSENGWRPHLIKNYDLSDDLYGGCNVEESAEDAQWRHQVFVDSANQPKFKREIVYVTWQLAL